MLKPKTTILIAAGAGGIVPNLVRISIALLDGQFQTPSVGRVLSYSLGLAMMCGAGAFMAWVFDEKEKKKAFYLGMGLPALLQLTFSNIAATGQAAPAVSVSQRWPSIVSVAYADPLPSQRVANRQLQLNFDRFHAGAQVLFLSADGKQKQSVEVKAAQSALSVPDFADGCTVGYPGSMSGRIALTQAPVTKLSLQVKENNWSGLLNALGASGTPSYTISVLHKEP